MIYLIFLALIAWAGPGWATEYNHAFYDAELGETILTLHNWEECQHSAIKCRVTVNTERVTVEPNKPDPCLAQMEAAMRAVAPFLIEGLAGKAKQPYHMELWSKDSRAAFDVWQDAKACWRSP